MKKRSSAVLDDMLAQAAEEQLGDALFGKLDIDASAPSELGALDPDDWVRRTGRTPFEFLTLVYRNPLQPLQHRIAAAKTLMDYSHRKLPQKLEVEADVTGRAMTIDAAALSSLSDKELTALEQILAKVSG